MNKPEPQTDSDEDDEVGPGTNQTDNGIALQTIIETMEHPGFTAEQLPELWRRITERPDGGTLNRLRRDRWRHGIDAMYRRCETYPQHAELAVILSEMPHGAWRYAGRVITQGDNLAKQATPEQIQQALVCEQQHPKSWWKPSDHVLTDATDEQLTGPVIEQLPWNYWLHSYATKPGLHYQFEDVKGRRTRHIVEHVQQQLLDGDNDAWVVFLGIIEHGTRIGGASELVMAIEQQNRRPRSET